MIPAVMINPVSSAGPVPDLVRPDLAVLFCGINPGIRSSQLGQHFARPGNRFWKALYGAGLTHRLLAPAEQETLLDYGLGMVNLVDRSSRDADDLSPAELRAGAEALATKAAQYRPEWVAVLGVQAYRTAFRRPRAQVGCQSETIGGASGLWLLPNPSGLQARYQLPEMIELFSALAVRIGSRPGPPGPISPDRGPAPPGGPRPAGDDR
jgi:TDG/mug DNA glycosylase family protein